ncbi:MAG: transposase [Okeania sp. SIO3B3]|nr:transposase [Okeania sp. SIO3B3]
MDADAVIVSEAPHKTLRALYGLIVEAPDPSNGADCLRLSPWSSPDLRAYAEANGPQAIFIRVDDCLVVKDKGTRHLEPVAFHHNHSQSTPGKPIYSNGAGPIEVRLQIGSRAYSYDHRLYLREKTVRQLNRRRPPEKRLRFRSKYRLTREMLRTLKGQLPPGLPVYVLYDSWYASTKLLKFCRRQGWHVICALKSNRLLNDKQLSEWNRDPKARVYLRGTLKKLPQEVCVFISKRHRGDKRPKYFLCTDLSLSAQKALSTYQARWAIEVVNFYLKQALGLGDFRVQSYEAVEKWYAIVFLPLTYLQWRLQQPEPAERFHNLADGVRTHRLEHARHLLTTACEQAVQLGQVEPVLKRFIQPLPPEPP